MNMNKKKKVFIFSLLLLSIFMFGSIIVYAAPAVNQTPQFVAENPCDEKSIKTVMRLFGYILLIAKFIVPLIIIGYGTFDVAKSVIDKDEKSLTKQLKQLGIRVLTGVAVFFIPNIVHFFFSTTDDIVNSSQYQSCADCLLKPNSCNVE